jgi:NADH-quinone oxidoreductase subunit H
VPFVLLQPVGFIIYLVSAVAEVNRSPFDLPEGESEIVAGYHIEYAGIKFAMFLLAEYVNAFAVSAIAVTLFMGGWQGPILPPYVWFFLKAYVIYFVLVWFRGTFPRLRIDQLMGFAWKFLVPVALLNFTVTGLLMPLMDKLGPILSVVVFLAANAAMAVVVMLLYSSQQPKAPRQPVLPRH